MQMHKNNKLFPRLSYKKVETDPSKKIQLAF